MNILQLLRFSTVFTSYNFEDLVELKKNNILYNFESFSKKFYCFTIVKNQ